MYDKAQSNDSGLVQMRNLRITRPDYIKKQIATQQGNKYQVHNTIFFNDKFPDIDNKEIWDVMSDNIDTLEKHDFIPTSNSRGSLRADTIGERHSSLNLEVVLAQMRVENTDQFCAEIPNLKKQIEKLESKKEMKEAESRMDEHLKDMTWTSKEFGEEVRKGTNATYFVEILKVISEDTEFSPYDALNQKTFFADLSTEQGFEAAAEQIKGTLKQKVEEDGYFRVKVSKIPYHSIIVQDAIKENMRDYTVKQKNKKSPKIITLVSKNQKERKR